MDLSWLIVGGGIHGVHLAIRLLVEGRVPAERLRIVDPGDRLLEHWQALAEVTGMPFLRSPLMHHLDVDAYSLERFARTRPEPLAELFTEPNDRPSTALFEAHCRHLIDRRGLDALHVRARAAAIDIESSAVVVETETGGCIRAERLVLAVGSMDQLHRPTWAPHDSRRVQHVFQRDLEWPGPAFAKVAVIGGGITAAQIASRLAEEGHHVDLVSRHALRTRQYDSEPGWFGPKYMREYERTQSLESRRALIRVGRNRGTVTPDVRRRLEKLVGSDRIARIEGDVVACEMMEGGLRLGLRDGARLEVDHVLLATGVTAARPGGVLVDRLVERFELPVARCGFPIVDGGLRWHPRVHVSGALAELELGPVARNIAGARRAGDRILASWSEAMSIGASTLSHVI